MLGAIGLALFTPPRLSDGLHYRSSLRFEAIYPVTARKQPALVYISAPVSTQASRVFHTQVPLGWSQRRGAARGHRHSCAPMPEH